MMRAIYLLFACLLFVSGAWAQAPAYNTPPHCQILDEPTTPLYRMSLAILPREAFDGYGSSGFMEIDGDWALAYFHDVLWGDIDLNPRLRATVIMDSAGLQLPNQLVELSLDAGWTLRTMGGTACQVRVRPGIYSDIEEVASDMLNVPFSLAVIQSFTDQLSGIVGFEVRPGFDREYMPIAGLAWQPADAFRLEAGIPETRADWFIDRLWSLHAGFQWLNTTYALRDKGTLDRGQITLEDYQVYGGFTRAVTGNVRFSCDIGGSFDRSVSFEREAGGYPRDVDQDNGFFLRLAMLGPF